MKILKGSLTETRYAWPTIERNKAEEHPLQTLSNTTYQKDEVTYMSDKLGLHRITNPDPVGHAVSLHCECCPRASGMALLTLSSVYSTECGCLWV